MFTLKTGQGRDNQFVSSEIVLESKTGIGAPVRDLNFWEANSYWPIPHLCESTEWTENSASGLISILHCASQRDSQILGTENLGKVDGAEMSVSSFLAH